MEHADTGSGSYGSQKARASRDGHVPKAAPVSLQSKD